MVLEARWGVAGSRVLRLTSYAPILTAYHWAVSGWAGHYECPAQPRAGSISRKGQGQ